MSDRNIGRGCFLVHICQVFGVCVWGKRVPAGVNAQSSIQLSLDPQQMHMPEMVEEQHVHCDSNIGPMPQIEC